MGKAEHGREAGSEREREGEGSGAMVPHKNYRLGELRKQEQDSTDRPHHKHHHQKSRKARRETAQEITEKERAAGIERDAQVSG